MTEREQIEEIAKIIFETRRKDPCGEIVPCSKACPHYELPFGVCEVAFCADSVYSAGYRKQSEGEWIEKKRFYASSKTLVHYQCSLCGVYLATKANFCPNCGAKMEK